MGRSLRIKDGLFLLVVALLALVFALDVISRAMPSEPAAQTAVPAGTAGEPRDVDMDALRRMLRRGWLSDHEAEFARPADEPEAPDSD